MLSYRAAAAVQAGSLTRLLQDFESAPIPSASSTPIKAFCL